LLLQRNPPRAGSSRVLISLTWLLASLATAALAHVLIAAVGALDAGHDAYADHAHATVVPIGLAAVALMATVLWRSAALRMSRTQAIDPAMLLARRFGTMSALGPIFTVTLGGLGTLLMMEFAEQLSTLGHIEGIADSLGGNVAVGLAIVVSLAAALTCAGLRSAAALLRVSASAAGVLAAWIVVKPRIRVDTVISHRAIRHLRRTIAHAAGQSHGLRAPPTLV
jgi:hypothetical protein